MIINTPKYPECTCPECKKFFIPTVKHQKLCGSPRCRQKAMNKATKKCRDKQKEVYAREDTRSEKQIRLDSETKDVILKNKFLLMPLT